MKTEGLSRSKQAKLEIIREGCKALVAERDALKAQVRREIRSWEVEQELAMRSNRAALEAVTNLVEVEAERDAALARGESLRELNRAQRVDLIRRRT